MCISEDVLEAYTKRPQLDDKERLSLATIVDLGTVLGFSEDGNCATVQAFREIGGQRVCYSNVEVLYASGMQFALSNALVLVVAPCSCIQDTQTGKILKDGVPFDGRGMKAIPLMNNSGALTKVLYDKEAFNIVGQDYSVRFGDKLSIAAADITVAIGAEGAIFQWNENLSMSITSAGTSSIYYKDKKVTLLHYIQYDGTEIMYRGAQAELTVSQIIDPSTYNDWSSITTYKADGTIEVKRGTDSEIKIAKDKASIKIQNNEVSVDGQTVGLKRDSDEIKMSTEGISLSKGSLKVAIGSTIKLSGTLGSLEVT